MNFFLPVTEQESMNYIIILRLMDALCKRPTHVMVHLTLHTAQMENIYISQLKLLRDYN